MTFFSGLVGGTAKGFKEGFEKIQERIADRTDQASQYHVARSTRQQEKFDDHVEETEKGIELLHGFFGDDPNGWEKAAAVFNQYGGTLAAAQQASEAGRLALAAAQKKEGQDVSIDFESFFNFAEGAFDPDNPLTLDDIIKRQVGQFTYQPGKMLNVNSTTGTFAKFLFGDVEKRIGNRINQDLQARGIDTSVRQPIERVLPSSFSLDGAEAMNWVKLTELRKSQADVVRTNAGATLFGIQGELYKEQADNLEAKTATWSAESQAKIREINSAIKLNGARAAKQILDTKLLNQFGPAERQAAIDVMVNEAKHRFEADDWEAFDVAFATKIVDLKRQVIEAEEAGIPQSVINGLQGEVRALEQSRLSYMKELGPRQKEDIISKTSPTTLWSNAFTSALQDAQLGDLVTLDMNGQIQRMEKGNAFAIAVAKWDAFKQFKATYGGPTGYPGTIDFAIQIQDGIKKSLQGQIAEVLSNVYETDQPGVWHEGGRKVKGQKENTDARNSEADTLEGQVQPYVSTNYKTPGNIIPAYGLVKGQIYKIPKAIIIKRNGQRWFDKEIVGTKHYNVKTGEVYGIWGGGRQSDFRFYFNSESS